MAKKNNPKTFASADEITIANAIAIGAAIIAKGETKIDAAMAIYEILETEPQDVIVKAFIEGASLTDKGAVTYWYTCRRRLTKARRAKP